MTHILAKAALALPFALLATGALAQTASPDDAVAAAKNQLGILEYCQTAGHIDGTAVEVQTKMLAILPAPTDAAKVDAAYAKGQAGTVSAMGVETSIAEGATAQGTDEASLCQQMAQMVEQAGAQLPQ